MLSHPWIAREREGVWRVGLTKFATRMLGEMVDHGFEIDQTQPLLPVRLLARSRFQSNFGLILRGGRQISLWKFQSKREIALVNKDCYGAGWLYMVNGVPDPKCFDVLAYQAVLDKTIDKILEKQKESE